MKFPLRFLLIAVCFGMPGPVSEVNALTVAENVPLKEGVQPAAAIVNGKPAIAWTDEDFSALKYARATDAEGTVWESPVTVDSGPLVGWGTTLLTVNGNPAVFYVDFKTDRLKFVRATDPEGTNWGTPVIVRSVWNGERAFSAQIVEGVPAITFLENGWVRFLCANDSNGSTWGTAKLVASGSYLRLPFLGVVAGRPAILYLADKNLRYVRANDATGSTWGLGTTVLSVSTSFDTPSFPLRTVNGRPSIAYAETSLYYIRANNATGSLWGSPVRLGDGRKCSLAVMNGRPAIGYYNDVWPFDQTLPPDDLLYIEATDGDGGTAAAWGPAVTVDSTGDVGMFPSLLEAGGRPALVYQDVTRGSLKYIRATNENPATRWPAGLLVLGPDGTGIPDGQTKDFGVVATDSTAVMDFRLKHPNSGGTDLKIQSVTVVGPDAAEFSITVSPPATTLAAGASSPFTVKYTPLRPGLKSAVLHIVSNAEGDSSLYDVFLTAVTGPDLSVEQPAGTVLSDGGVKVLPITSAGSTLETVFTVRNPGGAVLSGLTLTIDGPDAGEFVVVAPPAASLAAGESTTFTLRHVPARDGMKSAALHLKNNISGNKNPFDIPLHTEPGVRDPSFNPPPLSRVDAIAVQPDGKIVCAGGNGLTRLHPDGSIDTTFSPAPITPVTPLSSNQMYALAVQPDGRILIAGNFIKVDEQPRAYFARLNADGSLDPSFYAGLASAVYAIAVLPDGRILAGGSFTSTSEAPDVWLARFSPDGSHDPGFKPGINAGSIASHYNSVNSIALQPDGAILIGGRLGAANLAPAPRVARLSSSGALEFLSVPFQSYVRSVSWQENGGIFVGGDFAGGFARLLPDGTIDPGPSYRMFGRALHLSLQTDGKCLLAGEFSRLRGKLCDSVARVHDDGSLDAFNQELNNSTFTSFAGAMAVQADGRMIVSLGSSLIRLVNDPAVNALTTDGHTTVRWLRGGSAPEVGRVTIEVKPDGSPDWTLPRIATRFSGGWKVSGLTLPDAGSLRARGFSGSFIMESEARFTVSPSPLEAWRLQHFGTFSNVGVAADNFDLDRDGLTNFTEFAFGLSPVDRASNVLPEFKHTNGSFTATFTAPEGRDDILYSAEWSPTMQPGTWTAIPDTGTAPVHSFTATAGQRVFVRYRVGVR